MLMLAVIHCVNQLMDQGVENFQALAQYGRDEDLINTVATGFGTPALADMTATNAGTGKAARHVTCRDLMPCFNEQRLNFSDCSMQPSFAGFMGHEIL
jgi:hypothetical protein